MRPTFPACLAIIAALVVLAGCTEEPKVKKEEKPPEPVSAIKAFYAIFANARTWATDAQVLDIKSVDVDEKHACKEGKCWAWSVNLVSPSKGKLKNFTYSVIEAEGNLHQGVFANLEENFRGSRGQERPFLMQALKKDSTDAYKVAAAKSVDYMKKHPDVPITYEISYTPKHAQPAYRVIWGESVTTSAYSILVDAATGEYAETLH
jgi:hypothetical protein